MLTRRLQVLIDDARYRRLRAEARARKSSVGALIREAIDRAFPTTPGRKRAALQRILSAPRISAPDVDELKAELDDIRSGAKG